MVLFMFVLSKTTTNRDVQFLLFQNTDATRVVKYL